MTSEPQRVWIELFNRVERKTSCGSREEVRAVSPGRGKSDGVSGGRLTGLAGVAGDSSSGEAVERMLDVARQQLGMDIAFISEFVENRMAFRFVEGDATSFRFDRGHSIPLEETYCQRVVDERLTSLVPDARNHEQVRYLDITRDAGIGSYIGVPLRLSDGRLYGTMCCLSHLPDHSLHERDVEFMKVLARLIAEHLEREELRAKNLRLQLEATGISALLAALEARDGYTGKHSEAVVELSEGVVRRLGLGPGEVDDVRQAALLHDIGKIGVLDAILNKPGPLDEGEWAIMQQHPEIGARIVASIGSLAHLAPVVRSEHERWDGKGYPDGLSGEQIPLASRIIFVCDSFHAMISDRPYRKAMIVREALEEVERNAGTQFCPTVARALIRVVRETRCLR